MKRRDFLEWKARLGELDDSQMEELCNSLALLGKSPVGNGKAEDPDDWLLPGLIAALKNKGMLSTSAVPALKNGRGYKRYLDDAPTVRSRLIRLVKAGDTRSRDTMAYVVGNALILWCERKRLPESPGVVLSMVCHSKEALELQFPGYIDAQLFKLVLGNLDEKIKR